MLLLQGKKLVSDVENPNIDQVERDFCSIRQAYAHAQQEEVTEKETSAPIPKKYLKYEVSQRAYVLR